MPESEPALEFAHGRGAQKASPTGRHAQLQTTLAALINELAAPRRLARAFVELRTTFAGASSVPGLPVYRRDRAALASAGEIADDFLIAPDVAV